MFKVNHLSSRFWCSVWTSAGCLDPVYILKCNEVLPCDWPISLPHNIMGACTSFIGLDCLCSDTSTFFVTSYKKFSSKSLNHRQRRQYGNQTVSLYVGSHRNAVKPLQTKERNTDKVRGWSEVRGRWASSAVDIHKLLTRHLDLFIQIHRHKSCFFCVFLCELQDPVRIKTIVAVI